MYSHKPYFLTLSHICKMGSHNLFGMSTLQIKQFTWHVCTYPWVLQDPGPVRTVVLCDPCKNCKMKAHAHIFHSVDCKYELWWLINCEIKQTYTYSNDKRWHMALKREVLNISGHHFKHVHSNQYSARFLQTAAYIWQVIINLADMSAFCHRVLQPLDSCIHIRKITLPMLHTYIQHICIYIHMYTCKYIHTQVHPY